ncbi:MAG: DEAD/DEAH box helicase [Acidimicrobiia bacterium]|nr:DEAD/DEAH box helicase [Acidimicrobiia bacterium]
MSSPRRKGERPDPNAVLDGLKGFQRDTVEYAFERLYKASDSSRRFLVADEVGLGKTLVARGLIAKALDHLWEGPDSVEQIDIVYICSNAQIARQNVRKLRIGNEKFIQSGRLGFLPRDIHDLKENRVNYLALTPGTSFNLRSSMGTAEERVILYHLLQKVWPDHRAAPMNIMQGRVTNTGHFRWRLETYYDHHQLDSDLAEAFKNRLEAEGDRLRERYDKLCKHFQKKRKHIPQEDRWRQNDFIGELRSILAEVCVHALEPDLVILDEFQRFKQLLDGEDATSQLAKRLFNFSEQDTHVRILLLSATPYRMFTMKHESADDDHYQDFLRTVEFLDPDQKKKPDNLRYLLEDYRQKMYRIEAGIDPILEIKQKIESQLRKVMSRNERLSVETKSDAMLKEVDPEGLELTSADVQDFLALQKIGREVGRSFVIEYWKSAPYLLSFMDHYKLKQKVVERLKESPGDSLVDLVAGPGQVSLPWEKVEAYGELDPANARLRNLLKWMNENQAWTLLWLPPALPYYRSSGAWESAREQQFTKRLIFSTWGVVPKSVATMVSYEVERRIFTGLDKTIRNTPEARQSQRGLLQFSRSDGHLTGMPVLGMLYPSPGLARLGDPIQEAGSETTLEDALTRAGNQIKPHLDELTAQSSDTGRPDNREDQSWYWAAPILLDLKLYEESTREWFGRPDLADRWRGEEKGTSWYHHVEEVKKLAQDPEWVAKLGRPPKDLLEVLAKRAVAGPATTALRALTRATGPDTLHLPAARDAAARTAWAFRSLFNLVEAMVLIRGEGAEEGNLPYWRQVIDYCAAGNLQAVLDEYVHTLRDLEGLFSADQEEAWFALASTMRESLTIRTGAPAVDELRPQDNRTVDIQRHRMRNHFALRFGTQEAVEGQAGAREGQVRQAFNSPFWPFVLASTSVGQEGLDFHAYCHAIMHWNLPHNPVDLEQREGRVHRYKGHAIRKNVAQRFGLEALSGESKDVWQAMFDSAREQSSEEHGMVPYWLFPLPDGAYIERHVPALPLSQDAANLEALKRSLAVYRMVFGQPRQDDLVTFLQERCDRDLLEALAPKLRMDLSPRPREAP